jgi:hypothetical protein
MIASAVPMNLSRTGWDPRRISGYLMMDERIRALFPGVDLQVPEQVSVDLQVTDEVYHEQLAKLKKRELVEYFDASRVRVDITDFEMSADDIGALVDPVFRGTITKIEFLPD